MSRGIWLNPEFRFEVLAGNIPGWQAGQYFSIKHPVTSLNAQAIWENASDDYPWLASASKLQMSSSDNADGDVQFVINGLDADYEQITEIVEIVGNTAVETEQSFLRINDFYAVSGSGTIAGVVYISKTGDTLTAGVPAAANVLSLIQQHDRFSALADGLHGDYWAHSPVFTVPAGYSAIITDIVGTAGEGEELVFWGRARLKGTNFFTNQYPVPVVNTVRVVTCDSAIILGEGTDFIYYAAKVGQNANASIKTSYLLRKNSINNLP